MRVLEISDVHLEFQDDGGEAFVQSLPEDVDALIVAGDLGNHGTYDKGLRLLSEKFKIIFYVHGNHECYDGSIKMAKQRIRRLADKLGNVVFLDCDVVEHDGHRILGTTMWFRPHPLVRKAAREMNDFYVIRGNFPQQVREENARATKFLEDNVRRGDIVITHHAPSQRSLPPKERDCELHRLFYVCDMNELIMERQPAMWFHGHIHETWDYQLWGTRVLANPYGYHREYQNPGFNPGKIIEV